jgi:uncharacterized membrane protein required for colicin V production
MTFNWVDLLFIITVVLLVLNGLRSGAVFSLINLVSIPVGVIVAYRYGAQLTNFLAGGGLVVTPLITYGVLFFGSVIVVHLLAGFVRGIVKRIPLVSQGDSLLGGVVGFVEAWLLWLFLLMVLGMFLGSTQLAMTEGIHSALLGNVSASQLQSWQQFYNQAVSHSLFARVNTFFIRLLPGLPSLSSFVQKQ